MGSDKRSSPAAMNRGLAICDLKKLGDAVMKSFFARFAQDESGVTAIEYGLIAALIGVAVIVTAGQVGTDLSALFTKVSAQLTKS